MSSKQIGEPTKESKIFNSFICKQP